MLDERIADSAYAQLERYVAESVEQLEEGKALLVAKKDAVVQLTSEVARLESDITNMKQSRQSKIGVLEERFVISKKELQQLGAERKAAEQALSELVLESESAEQDLDGADESVVGIQKEIAALRKEEKKLEDKVAEIQRTYTAASSKLEERRSHLTLYDQQLKDLASKQSELAKQKSLLEIERKKTEHKITRLLKEESEAKHIVKKLEKTHPWIETEKEFFGREHTDYDFQRRDPASATRRLLELKETQGALSKKINKKVMGMIEKAEQEYQGLMNKRQIIENDKEKITSVIKELDTKKNEALETTWVKVTKDFGSIFGTLLPGTTAKLEPPTNGACVVLVILSGCDPIGSLVWLGVLTVDPICSYIYLYLSLVLCESCHRHDSGRTASLRCLRRRVEGEPDGAERWPALSSRAVTHPVAAALQASADVHPGRSRRRARPLAHTEHRADDSFALFALAVHRRVAQGGHVQQRKRRVPHQVRGRRLDGLAHSAVQVQEIERCR